MNTNNPLTFLLLAGALEGSVLGVLLFIRRTRNPAANRLLAVILLLLASSIGIHAIAEALDSSDRLHYFVIGALAEPPLRFRLADMTNFSPFLFS